jgi:serine/threonine protein kinase
MSIAPGTERAGLRFLRRLGAGAMGEVWEAEQLDLCRRVAVKCIAGHLAADVKNLVRFEREAQAIARVNSPHVVSVHALHRGDGEHLLVMELIAGGCTLRRAIGAPVDWLLATSAIRHLAEGLAAAHGAGVVHRDVKPDNVLLTPDGIAKLADFGLSRLSDGSQLTRSGASLGTPAYMAPEVWDGQVADAASDLYSLGATWYHLLTGFPPIPGGSLAELAINHQRHEPQPLAGVVAGLPQRIADLVHACLAKSPGQRPHSARALADALLALADEGIHLRRTVPELVRIIPLEPPAANNSLIAQMPTALHGDTCVGATPVSRSSPAPLAATLITPSPSSPSPTPPQKITLKAASSFRISSKQGFLFLTVILIVIGISLMTQTWNTSAITPEEARTAEKLQHILGLVRDQRWTTARQAIETFERSAISDADRHQAKNVRDSFEKTARTRVEQHLTKAVEMVGIGKISEARLTLEQAKEPAASCGWSDRVETALAKLPAP